MGENDIKSIDEEEENICVMKKHKKDKVNSHFIYDDLLCICKKLNKESSKLKHVASTSKTNILPLKY